MKLRALKTYRCGEPAGSTTAPPKKIAEEMVKHWGEHARIFPGGIYVNVPASLGKLLVAEKAAEEIS